MRITHEKMLELTVNMPMKQISIFEQLTVHHDDGSTTFIDGFSKPYLHRYFAGTFKDGKDLWLHNFKCSDSEDHLHNHGFEFETIMLCGNYTEDYRRGLDGEIITRYTSPCEWRNLDGAIERLLQKLNSPIKEAAPLSSIMLGLAAEYRSVDLFDWHRITHAEVDTWTAVIVGPERVPMWFFNDSGMVKPMNSSPREWHKQYNCRPANGVVIGDNKRA